MVLTVMVHVFELHMVLQTEVVPYLLKTDMMELNDATITSHGQRLKAISRSLREIRFSEGRNQDEFSEWGASRRQIQRGEQVFNLTLTSLFNLLDCYGYRLDEFFEGME
jgi:hypothetical protein